MLNEKEMKPKKEINSEIGKLREQINLQKIEIDKLNKKINDTFLADNSSLVQLHRTAQIRANSHRETIWEEQKHFTWWISIIFSALIIIISNDFLKWYLKLAITMVCCLFGSIIAYKGIKVITKEAEYFAEAIRSIKEIEKFTPIVKDIDKSPDQNIKGIFKTIYWIAFCIFIITSIIFLTIYLCVGCSNNNFLY